ncbi:helix-turn-helix domain-containing protein [Streptococcus gordonii]|uniref:helix-turn-helix domain-containing protein n=1 Tax=Streptococcus gordonii TaxID=1302 RepID=UPI000779E5F2|nr:helix-turn-helix transcriptional regulator [Streptococcus gordonii]VTT26909.1 transcriptional regulator PlcR [Streptococcus gordonii]
MQSIGNKIKTKRKSLGLSQKDLADGICEQSLISKIERTNYFPSADVLYKLSQKLQVDINFFFDESYETVSDLRKFITMSSKLLEHRNYTDLEYLYNLEKSKSNSFNEDEQSYLTWIEAIILFYNYDKKDSAIELLKNLIDSLFDYKKNIFLKALNTLTNFYSNIGYNEEYERNYKKLLQIYSTKDFQLKEDIEGYIRLKYNFAHHLTINGQLLDALETALETIDFCKNNNTAYQMPSLLLLVANSCEKFLSKEEIIQYYTEAKTLAKLYGNDVLYLKIKNYLINYDND